MLDFTVFYFYCSSKNKTLRIYFFPLRSTIYEVYGFWLFVTDYLGFYLLPNIIDSTVFPNKALLISYEVDSGTIFYTYDHIKYVFCINNFISNTAFYFIFNVKLSPFLEFSFSYF